MANKGFTLLEMTLVLCMISLLLWLVPGMMKRGISLTWECEKIKDILIQRQAVARNTKTSQTISISYAHLTTQDGIYFFTKGVTCSPMEIWFNERGNVNMANTITCSYKEQSKDIVITLGNGNVYVR